jgi:hypothetical protein
VAVSFIVWLGARRGSRIDVIWRLFNTDGVRNRIRVRTAVDLNIIQVATIVGEQDNLQRAIGICELKIRLEEHNVAAVAVRLRQRWKLHIWRDNHLKVVTAAIAKIREGRMLEVASQKLGIGKLAMTRNELRPEYRLVCAIAHAPNEN